MDTVSISRGSSFLVTSGTHETYLGSVSLPTLHLNVTTMRAMWIAYGWYDFVATNYASSFRGGIFVVVEVFEGRRSFRAYFRVLFSFLGLNRFFFCRFTRFNVGLLFGRNAHVLVLLFRFFVFTMYIRDFLGAELFF